MKPQHLQDWRAMLELTQAQAADLFGVSRATIINWENGVTPIPKMVEALCDIHGKRWKMGPNYGPVTLIYSDGPMWMNPYGPNRIPIMQRELYKNNKEALERAFELIGQPNAHNIFIMEESGDIVWNQVQLHQEYKNRQQKNSKRQKA
jgi:DNA-binding XRE family transcriptional regulator